MNRKIKTLPLVVLCSKLVHPTKFGITVLAIHIPDDHEFDLKKISQLLPLPDHVPASEHDPVLHLTELEVDHLVEQECSPCGSSEPSTQC